MTAEQRAAPTGRAALSGNIAIYVVTGLVVFALVWTVTARPAATIAVVATAYLTLALVVDGRRGVGMFSPLLPLLLAVITTMTVPAMLGYFDKPGIFGASATGNFMATAYFCLFLVAAVTVYISQKGSKSHRVQAGPVPSRRFLPERAFAAWIVTVLLASFAMWRLALTAGGPAQYIIGLASRTTALAGQGVYVWLLLTPGSASLLLLASYWARTKEDGKSGTIRAFIVPLIPVAVTAFFLLATGNRMNLVVYIASIAYVRHRTWRPLSGRLVVGGIVAVLFLGLALPTILRSGDSLESRHLKPVSLQSQYSRFGPINTFGQIPAFSLAIDHDGERYLGSTYLAAVTMFIPRSIAPWKLPDVGESVTKEILPSYWFDAGTGAQVGAPGEAYLNFGPAGVLLLGALGGAGMRRLRRLGTSVQLRDVLLYSLLLPRTALYFRGGFATVTTYLVMDLVVLMVCATVASGPTTDRTKERR